jgi:hypothetical protein
MNPAQVVLQFKMALNQNQPSALPHIRKTFYDPAFFAELDKYLRGAGSPDTKSAVLDNINDISIHCRDASAKRKNELTNVRFLIGGGLGLAASGIIALAKVGPVAFIPIFCGIWIALTAASNTGALGEEEQIYQDIAARSVKILEKYDG